MKWLLKTLLALLFLGVVGASLLVAGVYFYLEPKLPAVDNLREVRLQVPLRVYSRDGALIAEYGEKRRIPLTYEQIPHQVIQAFLAAEDDRYFEHPGVDYQGLIRAAVQLALTGERRQGGSTITMQVARNFFLTREKTFVRKINEILLALRIERELDKQEILELYLNKIYLGQRAYGVGAAAYVYYGRELPDLSLAEVAMIAGLPKAPSRFNPISGPERAKVRRNYVLGRMRDLDFIDEAAYREATAAPLSASLHAAAIEVDAPYVAEMARAAAVERFGEEDAYTGGYRVVTSIDGRMQAAAQRSLANALDAYDRRHGWRGAEAKLADIVVDDEAALDNALAAFGPIGRLRPGIVVGLEDKGASVYLGAGERVKLDWKGIEWAAPLISEDRRGAKPKTAGDVLALGDVVRVLASSEKTEDGEVTRWRLAQIPAVEGAFVAVDPQDGAILALTGGYDFFRSKFNRATQAQRQPGSGFKPFIYSAALEAGFTPASIINDAPVVVEDASLEGAWRPENYSGKFFGPTRLRMALTKSRNLVSIRLLRAMGIEHALAHIEKFGFDRAQLPGNLSLALGSAAVTPLEMARAYSVLANGGFLVDPYFVQRIEQDGQGIVYSATPARVCPNCADTAQPADDDVAPRVISAENRFLMYSMMQDVIKAGTATRARSLGRKDLAGKTGTTNDQRDAWFNGYNQSLVASAWVGFDDHGPLGRGEVGGRAALPAWIDFMRAALDGVPDVPPEMPETMLTVRISAATGLRATAGDDDSIYEYFRPHEAPTAGATVSDTGTSRPLPSEVENLF